MPLNFPTPDLAWTDKLPEAALPAGRLLASLRPADTRLRLPAEEGEPVKSGISVAHPPAPPHYETAERESSRTELAVRQSEKHLLAAQVLTPQRAPWRVWATPR